MSSDTDAKLVRMANQIASFFATQPGDKAVAGTVQHLKDFWDPRMRAQMAEILARPETGLSDVALAAATELCDGQTT